MTNLPKHVFLLVFGVLLAVPLVSKLWFSKSPGKEVASNGDVTLVISSGSHLVLTKADEERKSDDARHMSCDKTFGFAGVQIGVLCRRSENKIALSDL